MPKIPMMKMARVVARSLARGSACKMYPRQPPTFYASTRGALEFEPSRCILCGLCAKNCPGSAIVVNREGHTWGIDRLRCISCGVCVEACPKKALSLRADYSAPVPGPLLEKFMVKS